MGQRRPWLWSLATATWLLVAFQTPDAQAVLFDLAPPGKTSFFASNVGDARSFIFDANSSFDLNSVGIRMDPLISAFTLRADLYSVAPGTLNRGGLLTSSSVQPFTDGGLAFYDVLFPTTIAGGARYELELLPPTPGAFGFNQFDMEFFNYQGFPVTSPPDPPYTVGPITVLDGSGPPGSNVGGPANSVIAHFRIDVGAATAVPEPGSVVLLGAGLGAIAVRTIRRWRRRPL